MKTTVVIPCWNGAGTLAQCLQSVFELADAENLEVLVVDDASTDDSVAVAGRFACRVVRMPKNGGAGRARNEGVRLATGDLIFFTDADVVLPKDALRLAMAAKKSREADCVVGVFSAENPYADFFSQYKSLYCNYKYQGLSQGTPFNTAAAVVPREILLELGGFDESLSAAEDNDFGERMYRKGYRSVIEHRMEVLHLKEFRFKSLLVNDFKKSLVLAELFFGKFRKKDVVMEAGFSDISLSMMMNIPLVYLALGGLAALPWTGRPGLWAVALPAVCFILNNFGFFGFLLRKKGMAFASAAVPFTFLDYVVVGLATLKGARALRAR